MSHHQPIGGHPTTTAVGARSPAFSKGGNIARTRRPAAGSDRRAATPCARRARSGGQSRRRRPARVRQFGPAEQLGAGHEDVHEIGAAFQQALYRCRQQMTQTPCLVGAYRFDSQAALDVAGEESEDLAEWQVRVADAHVGVAVAGGNDQVRASSRARRANSWSSAVLP